MKKSMLTLGLVAALLSGCGGSSGPTSSNPTMQSILNNMNTLLNNCPNWPKNKPVKQFTQDQVDAIVAACSEEDLMSINAAATCLVTNACGAVLNQAGLNACPQIKTSAGCGDVLER